MTIKFCSSVLFVKDIAASRHFYEDLLGQQVDMDLGVNVGYVGGFAIWEIESAFSMIYHHAPEARERLGGDNLELYFETEALDAVQQRLSETGVKLVHEIYEQPWGQRALRVYDPDGHIVELGEPMPFVMKRMLDQGMDKEEISARTFMPLPVVEHMLAEISAG